MPDRKTLETELQDLDVRREGLERRLRLALDRRRFASDADSRAQAEADEQALLRELDRVMTRTRAVEGQILRHSSNS